MLTDLTVESLSMCSVSPVLEKGELGLLPLTSVLQSGPAEPGGSWACICVGLETASVTVDGSKLDEKSDVCAAATASNISTSDTAKREARKKQHQREAARCLANTDKTRHTKRGRKKESRQSAAHRPQTYLRSTQQAGRDPKCDKKLEKEGRDIMAALLDRLERRTDGDDDARLVVEVLSCTPRTDVEADGDAMQRLHGRVWPRFEVAALKQGAAEKKKLVLLRVFFKTAPSRLWSLLAKRATTTSRHELPFACGVDFDRTLDALAAGSVGSLDESSLLDVLFVFFFFCPLVLWASEAAELSPRLLTVTKSCSELLWPLRAPFLMLTAQYHTEIELPYLERLTDAIQSDPHMEVREKREKKERKKKSKSNILISAFQIGKSTGLRWMR